MVNCCVVFLLNNLTENTPLLSCILQVYFALAGRPAVALAQRVVFVCEELLALAQSITTASSAGVSRRVCYSYERWRQCQLNSKRCRDWMCVGSWLCQWWGSQQSSNNWCRALRVTADISGQQGKHWYKTTAGGLMSNRRWTETRNEEFFCQQNKTTELTR